MVGRLGFLACLCLSVFFSGCSDDSATGGGGATGAGGAATGEGLPCDVATIVEAHCLSCHGNPPSSSAPQALVTAADWAAPAPSDPSKSNAEVSVARMQDASSPMPPEGLISGDDVKVVADWVAAGAKGGTCEPVTTLDPILNADPTCTSGETWPMGQDFVPGKSREEMFPGMPCNDCHQHPSSYGFFETGPTFKVAGTVFPSGHEPDACAGMNGVGADVIVHIEDATGRKWNLRPNQAGNFYIFNEPFTAPYSAWVTQGSATRAMSLKPTNGDCNLCHTQEGSSGDDPNGPVAPGRIVPPATN